MIIIFDLDYTLLDTKKLHIQTARAMGLGLKAYFQSCQRYFGEKVNYNVYKHISALAKDGRMKRKDNVKARTKVLKILRNINDLLYPEAEPLLQELKKRDHNLILLTFGDPVWQGLKTKNLKIRKYFSRIIITNKTKGQAMGWLKKEKEKIVFVNDNAKECLEIKKSMPQTKIILIKGPFSHNIKHNFKICQLKNCLPVLK